MRLHRGTEIVIDGFPRSANTFASESFRLANPDRSLAHHLHDRRRIRQAIGRKIPVILIIREPDGCVNSFANAIPTGSVDFFYTEYAKFYEGLLGVLSDVVVADFEEVTTSWPTIIQRCNQKFGTSYRSVGLDAREEILQRVDEFGKGHGFGIANLDQDRFEKVVSRPSSSRNDAGVAEVANPEVRQRAIDVYTRILDIAATQVRPQ